MRKLIPILIVLITQISCNNHFKLVKAKLTNNVGKDSSFQDYRIKNNELLDLKFCLENYHYPPRLSKNIFWIKPDTIGYSSLQKENIAFKYKFDDKGKVTMYFYQGSMISGIFPLPYFFQYNQNNPELIENIIDEFYKIKYRIEYDELKNVRSIEKLDSLNKRIEVLTIEIK